VAMMKIGNDLNTMQLYTQLSSGRRINSAADDAAGLAISEKMMEQIKGFDQGIQNTQDMNNLARTAEGALGSIHDGLQRMRELAVQASNGILTEADRGLIQIEIHQIKEFIGDTVKNTEFNTIKVLDGTFGDKNVAMNPNGSGMKMSIENTGLEALGIKDFDVTSGDFDISVIDDAISNVSERRSGLGASSNRMEHSINASRIAYENQVSAQSRIADMDMAKGIMSLKRNQVLDQYRMFMQKEQMNIMGSQLNLIM
jgi:flagellin